MDKVQTLLDKEAIRELRYKFAQALDYQDWQLLQNLFTDELDVDLSALGVPVQKMRREEFSGLYKHAFSREGLKTQHNCANFRIQIEGDSATSQANFFGQHYIQGFADGEEFLLRGEYVDKLVRTAAGWKINATKLNVFYATGNPGLLAS
jgi:hypothetical protein